MALGESDYGVWPPDGVQWTARVLGRFELANAERSQPKFRSKTAFGLLGYLLIHGGSEVPNHRLYDLFWPDSDGDRQAQNLRRAVADIRDVLEADQTRGSVLRTREEAVSLNNERIAVDLERFTTVAEAGLASGDPDSVKEATELYYGPVLAPLDAEWAIARRLGAEELYSQCIGYLSDLWVSQGRIRDALKLGRSAAIAAPFREDVHIALIRAYKAADLETEALRQFEELERLLDDRWGDEPSQRAKAALAGQASHSPSVRPSPVAPKISSYKASSAAVTGGGLATTSTRYVVRPADRKVEGLLSGSEPTVLLFGPRQVGKTSLMARSLDFARRQGSSVILTDIQAFGNAQLSADERFYQALAASMSLQIGLHLDFENDWNRWLGPNLNLDSLMARFLAHVDRPLCWSIDEADRLFDQPYSGDFFGLIRSWHNRRALDPDGPWKRLTVLMAYATDAHLFIKDASQSPFNVGERVDLVDFSVAELEELNRGYGSPLPASQCADLWEVTRGHPFLSSFALEKLASGELKLENFKESAAQPDGPFKDHFKRVWRSLSHDPEIVGEVAHHLNGDGASTPRLRERLFAAGVLSPSGGFRVPAYESYLKAALAGFAK